MTTYARIQTDPSEQIYVRKTVDGSAFSLETLDFSIRLTAEQLRQLCASAALELYREAVRAGGSLSDDEVVGCFAGGFIPSRVQYEHILPQGSQP